MAKSAQRKMMLQNSKLTVIIKLKMPSTHSVVMQLPPLEIALPSR
jgi:hypothetical protein